MALLSGNTNPAAKSFTTGEFYYAIGVAVAMVLVSFKVIDANQVNDAANMVVDGLAALATLAGLATLGYAMLSNRTNLKQTLIEKGAPPVVDQPQG